MSAHTELGDERARQLLANADMRIEVVKREINQGALAGLGSEISDYAAALVIAALDTFDEHLKPVAEAEAERLRAELAEWNTAERHRAFSHCAQNIGHVTMAAFGEKIAEKVQERAGRRQAEAELERWTAEIVAAYTAARATGCPHARTSDLDHVSAMGRLTAIGQLMGRLGISVPDGES